MSNLHRTDSELEESARDYALWSDNPSSVDLLAFSPTGPARA